MKPNRKIEMIALLTTIVVAFIFDSAFGDKAAFIFVFGGVFGSIWLRVFIRPEKEWLERQVSAYRYVLRQYAGLNDKLGDQARDVLKTMDKVQEEMEKR